jgi:hypothetical protein
VELLPQSEELLGDDELARLGEAMAAPSGSSAPADFVVSAVHLLFTLKPGEREVDSVCLTGRARASGSTAS